MIVCKICGRAEDPSQYYDGPKLVEYQMCFNCNFWREMLEEDTKRPPHTYCMIDGTHYVIAPEDDSDPFRGFGGAEFHIHFKDGYKVVTHNLWCQGEPNEHWKPQFPDNADFDWQWKKIGNYNYLIPKENEEIPDELISQAETNIGM